jgi:superkiller protein 3
LYLIQKNFDQVISECGLAVADPTYKARANAYTNIGIAYYNKGDMAKARENYEQALKLNPAFVYAHNELGKLYMSTGRYGEAVAEFQLAVQGYPTYDEAYYNLGLAYMKLNDSVNACEAFRKVADISPNSEFGVNSNRYINTVCK